MEQPPEETPEVREKEEKEEVAEAEGAQEPSGGPEQVLPSSSYAGEWRLTGASRQHGDTGPAASSILWSVVGQSGYGVKPELAACSTVCSCRDLGTLYQV